MCVCICIYVRVYLSLSLVLLRVLKVIVYERAVKLLCFSFCFNLQLLKIETQSIIILVGLEFGGVGHVCWDRNRDILGIDDLEYKTQE